MNRWAFKKPLLEQLEQKRLLDAAGFTTIGQATSFESESLEVDFTSSVPTADQFGSAASQLSTSIIFVDEGVADREVMLAEFDSAAEVVLLSADRDGIEQISDTLEGRSGLSSVHIVSHGDEGEVRLGNTVLTMENLQQYNSQLAAWGNALTGDADILFYGCDLAGNQQGEKFIQSVSELTGADVAASDDLTGNVLLGGDWELEAEVGTIETAALAAPRWTSTLMDTDRDGIDDAVDVDDDNDGILDTVEGCHDPRTLNDTQVVFMIDTSGSVSAPEFADWVVSLNDTATEILSRNPDAEISVMQFGGTGPNMQSIITHPLANAHPNFLATDRISVGSSDHLPDALAEAEPFFMAGGALDMTTGTNNTLIVFSDGVEASSSNLSNPPAPSTFNSTDAPDDFGIYPIIEATYDIRIIVAHAGGDATGQAASVTISSEDVNGNDLAQLGAFDLTDMQVDEVASAALYEDYGTATDTDGDGQPDCQDVDSDGDGILDNIEAQSTVGYIAPSGVDLNDDGLDDAYDNRGSNALNTPATELDVTAPHNSDADAIPDYLDIDSDNDGITDNVEGQTTAGYKVPTGVDLNSDGLDDAYDTRVVVVASDLATATDVLSPANTDSDAAPDFRGTDSDNDGIADVVEAGHGIPQATIDLLNDADSDGLMDEVDTVDNAVTWDVVDADVVAGEFTLADTDGDVVPGRANAIGLAIDYDWREGGLPDKDGDGVVDFLDVDDDNDGIIDELEYGAETLDVFYDFSDNATSFFADTTQNGDSVFVLTGKRGTTSPALFTNGQLATGPHLTGSQDFGTGMYLADGATGTMDFDFMGDTDNSINNGDRVGFRFINGGPEIFVGFEGEEPTVAGEVWNVVVDDGTTSTTLATLGPYDADAGNPWVNFALNYTVVNDQLTIDTTVAGFFEDIAAQGTADSDLGTFADITATTTLTVSPLLQGFSSVGLFADIAPRSGTPNSAIDNVRLSLSYSGVDSDGDGFADHCDIDADNDGITDNVEAQSTAGYIAPSGVDANGDGLDDAYDTRGSNAANAPATAADVTAQVDSDGDGTFDYLDTDSDNDGIPDVEEAGHGISQATIDLNNDADGDGLMDEVDVVDNTVAWDVVDDDVVAGEFTLADTPGDVVPGRANAVPLTLDYDWRDANEDAEITLAKSATGSVPASSGTNGNFDVTYEFVFEDTGAVTLDNLTLTEDFATQFGGAFIGLVGSPTITAGAGAVAPTANAAYDGGTTAAEAFDGTTGELETGETITVTMVVEIDPDAATATYNTLGELENQAVGGGTTPLGTPVTDQSDDEGMLVELVDGVCNTYSISSGLAWDIPQVRVTDGATTLFYPATSSSPPALADLESSLNSFLATQGITTTHFIRNFMMTGANSYSYEVFNEGGGPAIGVNFIGSIKAIGLSSVACTVEAESGDDPTPLLLPEVSLEKSIASTAPAASGTPGNFDVTYEMTLTNVGNATITNITMTEDFATQFGGAFVQTVSAMVVPGAGAVAPMLSGTYDGGATDAEFFDTTSGELETGESITVTVTVEVDPDNSTAATNAEGAIENQATAGGTDPDDNPVTDTSDNPDNPTDNDPDSDNDPDDPTTLHLCDAGEAVVQNDINQTLENYDVDGNILTNDKTDGQTYDVTIGIVAGQNSGLHPNVNGYLRGWLEPGPSFSHVTDSSPLVWSAGTGDWVANADTIITNWLVAALAGDNSTGTNYGITANQISITDVGTTKNITIHGCSDLPNWGLAFLWTPGPVASYSSGDFLSANSAQLVVGDGSGTPIAAATTFPTTQGGSIEIKPDGSYTYTPPAGFSGEDTIMLEVLDGLGNSFDNELVIDVLDYLADPTNAPPFAGDDHFETTQDGALSSNLGLGTGGNDNDADLDPSAGVTLTMVDPGTSAAATGPINVMTAQGGTVVIQPNGNFTYTPPAGFTGFDSFDYSIVDPIGATDGATATFTVTADPDPASNQAPHANDDAESTYMNVGFKSTVRSNDTDPDGDNPLVTEIDGVSVPDGGGGNPTITLPSGSTITMSPSGSYGYTPAPGFVGNEHVTYTISDPSGESCTATLYLTVLPPKSGIEVTKEVTAFVPSASGVNGNFDVTYEFVITNVSDATLDNLTLTEDFATQMGGAFIGLVGTPSIIAGAGAVAPVANAAYDGGATDASLLDGVSGEIETGESITIRITVELDPDAATAVYNVDGELENQATAIGEDPGGNPVSDTSDDPTDPTGPDDPTTFDIGDVTVLKTIMGTVAAASGTVGNFDITYEIGLTNTGTATIDNLTMTEDFATQFGGAFINIVGTPAIVAGAGAVIPTASGTYDGGTTDDELFDRTSGELETGESVTVTLTIELDPDAAGAITNADGEFLNQAIAGGTDPDGNPVSDNSDDPTDPTDVDPDGDNDPDDPTVLNAPGIEVTKEATATAPAASGTAGNFDVTYEYVITNTGISQLDNLTLNEDFQTQFGGAFIGLIGAPTIVAGTGAVAPTGNAAYDGGATDGTVLDGISGELDAGETVTIQITVEIDPDAATAITNADGELENQATATGDGPDGIPVEDDSDDPTDPTGDDDPTTLSVPVVELTKEVINTVPASSGIANNYDVTYEFVLTNVGSVTLDELRMFESFAGHFGGAFVGIVGTPTITAGPGAVAPNGSLTYDGGMTPGLPGGQVFDIVSGEIDPGEFITVQIVAEIDPDNPTAIYNADGELENWAVGAGTMPGLGGDVYEDSSDDPTDPTDFDQNGDNDPDDPTTITFPEIDVTKATLSTDPAASGTSGNFDVTYEFVISNVGNVTLDNLALTEDFATQFSGAFIGVIGTPSITAGAGAVAPASNAAYDGGTADAEVFDGASGELEAGETVTVQVTVEIDPDAATATYNAGGELENQATATGDDPTGTPIEDDSDDPNDPTNDDPNLDGNPDDPTGILLGEVSTEKSIASSGAAASGTAGNFDVTYDIVLTNTGNATIDNLTMTEDFATQFGGAFIGLVGTPTITPGAGAIAPTANAAYDGGATDDQLFDTTSGELEVGESVTVTLTVEIDPDVATAVLSADGALENQAVAGGTDPDGHPVTDTSDDPADPTDVDPDGDNDPDDPTGFTAGAIEVTKTATSVDPAASGVNGNFDVAYEFVITNTGSLVLDNLTLTEDFVTQMGGAFIGLIGTPSIVVGAGVVAPTANAAYDGGTTDATVLDGVSGEIDPGESITITLTVEIDPDAATAITNADGDLENQATATGDDPDGNPAQDTSDDPTDPTGEDDPTTLSVGDVTVLKTVSATAPAASGTAGNFDITYEIELTNIGTATIDNLTMTEDFATQFGGAFINIVGSPAIVAGAGAIAPTANAAYDGGTSDNELFDTTSGELETGESITVSLTIELDPDAAGTVTNADGEFINQATAGGTDPDGNPVTDTSDDPTDPTDTDPDGDNDPDDPTVLTAPAIEVTKEATAIAPAASGSAGNFDVTYEFVITNSGISQLDNLTLTEDFATQFGGAFIGMVGSPNIVAGAGAIAPAGNAAFDGGATDATVLDGISGELDAGEFVTIQMTVEVDPDAATATYNADGVLENQATATGDGPDGNPVDDDSDDPTNPSGGPDDPTTLSFGEVSATKTIASSVVAASGVNGNLDVTYEIVFTNIGNETIDNLTMTEDFATQFGGAFVGMIGTPTITAGAGAIAPIANAAYDGGTTDDELFDTNSGELEASEFITVTITVELDPDNATANYDADGALANQATAGGTDPDGNPVDDNSDDLTNPTDNDPDGDGNPDDPTTFTTGDVTVLKGITGIAPTSSGAAGNFDITYEIELTSVGNATIDNLTMTEDFATQFGGAFIGIVGSPTIVAGTGAVVPMANAAYDGGTTDDELFDTNSGELEAGESITVTIIIELDPDAAGAIASANGEFTNQAVAGGTDPDGNPVTDDSDDPTDPTDNDPDGDNDPDDPTVLTAPAIEVTKEATAIAPAASGTAGNFDVTYEFVVNNSGISKLDNLTLTEDFATQFGGAFIGMVGSPAIVAGAGAVAPLGNAAYDGGASDATVLDGISGELDAGEFVTIQITVEVDPDAATATYNAGGELENQATATGDGPDGNPVEDDSDDPTNPSGGPDDPTTLNFGEVSVLKTISSTAVASSGTVGNFDITYEIELTNIGNATIDNLTMLEDFATQFGGAFINIIGTPAITAGAGAIAPTANVAYDGGATDDELFDTVSGELEASESVTVSITVEIDPDAATAVTNAAGALENQATAGGNDPDGNPVADTSDDPTDPTDNDPDGDGDPDDPTSIVTPAIEVTKVASVVAPAASGINGNYDVSYEFVITNIGNVVLDNLTLTEDFATHMGGAFINVIGTPTITPSTGAVAPTANAAYDGGTTDAGILDGASGEIDTSESVTIQITVELDPDAPTATYNVDGELANSADATGDDPAGNPVSDASDDPTVPNDNPEDPTTLTVGDVTVEKTIINSVPSASGTAGNFDVTYEIVLSNVGNATIDNLTMAEDFATQFGGAFIGIVGTPIGAIGPGAVLPLQNAAYDGGATDAELFDTTSGELDAGEFVMMTITVEVDPDAVTAVTNSDGALANQATAGGFDPDGNTVMDDSDDPTNPTNDDPDGDGDPDDPTTFSKSDISVTKEAITAAPAASGTTGNFDITYEYIITNTGSVELDNLSLTEDLTTQFGGAFIALIGTPTITSTGTAPGANAAFDGGDAEVLDGTGSIQSGEMVTVTITAEIDPDNAAANFNADGELENQATAEGTDPDGEPVDDMSDDPTNPTDDDPDGDNDPDDPTGTSIAVVEVLKSATSVDPAASGVAGNFDITYELTLTNTGNTTIDNLTMVEDFATQFGGAFINIVGAPIVTPGTGAITPTLSGMFDGGVTDDQMFDMVSGELEAGESVTVTITVEVDPDAATAVTNVGGELENSATAGGTDPDGNPVEDDSSDPSDPSGGPDGPTAVGVSDISVTKEAVTSAPATSGTVGNFDVTYEYIINNTGSEPLDNLSLTEDFATQFGGAFINLLGAPTITSTGTAPGANAAYDGATDAEVLDGTGSIAAGETVTVRITVEIDPDNATANFNADGELENQATATGTDTDGDPVDDTSDDPTNPTDEDPEGDNDPDDPTGTSIADVEVLKSATSVGPAASGVSGNFDITYELMLTNTGNTTIDNLTMVEDFATQFGGAFVNIIGTPTITVGTGAIAPTLSGTFDGGVTDDEMFDTVSGELEGGESITVTITVEVDPDAATAVTNAGGELENSATAGGSDPDGNPVEDDSSDPSDPSGGPDDPTGVGVSDISVTKEAVTAAPAASGTAGNFDVTYEYIITNTGSEPLDNLSLTEDFATQFGGAFINLLGAPTITSTGTAPGANAAYDGAIDAEVFDGTGSIAAGETVTVTITAEGDPDNATANYNADGALSNQATASGEDPDGDPVDDTSDDPTNPTDDDPDNDNDPDDPTDSFLAQVETLKFNTSIDAATSGVAGNFDITYDIVLTNTGNATIDNLTMVEDFATQFGGAFINIVGMPTITAGTGAVAPTLNAAFDGGVTDDEMFAVSGELDTGESITVTVTVEVDPNAVDAITNANGGLENSATAGGSDPDGNPVEDDSSDPSDPSGDPDEPTSVGIADISATKAVAESVPASSGVPGNFDVTYEFVIENTGSWLLNNLTLTEDFQSQFGGAFIGLIGSPTITSTGTAPGANPAFDGGADAEVFDGTGTIAAVETVTVLITIELDPDNPAANFAADGTLENQATVGGDGPDGNPTDDTTDDPNDPTDDDPDGDNDPDDPTGTLLPDVQATKSATSVVPAASGVSGNFDITYDITLTSTGNATIDNLTILEDFASQFGGAFIGLVGAPTVTAGVGAVAPTLNSAFDGGVTNDEMLAAGTGELDAGESITVTVTVEVDPDAAGAILSPTGELENSATAGGTDPDGDPVTDDSHDPTSPPDGSGEPDPDNDPDDPTGVGVASLEALKSFDGAVPAASGVSGNIDASYTFTITNTGTVPIDNLTLIEDFATQMGGAFIGLVGTPTITASTGAAAPNLSSTFDGGTTEANLFDGTSGELDSSELITVTLTAEIDPDSPTAILNATGALENSATVGGDGPDGDPTSDDSDDPNDPTDDDPDNDNDPDDPTGTSYSDLDVTKATGDVIPASSGVAGNFDITYVFTFSNTGTAPLNSLSIVDDFVTQFGGNFIAVVTPVTVNNVDATTPPGANSAYAGGPEDMLDGTGLLESGQSFTATLTIEVDPDADPSVLVNGGLSNSATATGTDPDGNPTDDISDDPDNPTDDDPNGDNNPDDETGTQINDVSLTKTMTGITPAASGTADNLDVAFEFTITNTGTSPLTDLSLTEDMQSQYGGAFVGLVGIPTITAGAGSVAPSLNAGFDGGASDAEVFDGVSGAIDSSETVTVTMIVEVDPDAAGAVYGPDGQLVNSATIAATAPDDDCVSALSDGSATCGTTVSDDSDDPTNPTDVDPDGDNDPDDPTGITQGEISAEKVVVSVVPAASGVNGNFDFTYEFTVANVGIGDLTNLSVVDDFAGQFGANFIGVVGNVTITNIDAMTPPGANASYTGNAEDLLDGTGLLANGQSFMVTVTVEIDPDADPSIALSNSATVSGDDPNGNPTTDTSDDPNNPMDDDPDNDNNPDDPTIGGVGALEALKTLDEIVPASSGTMDNIDVTYTITVNNVGSWPMDNFTLTEDFASQFGGAFIGLVGNPTMTASTGAIAPNLNAAYDGGLSDADLLDGITGELDSSETFTITLIAEVDPDNPAASDDLSNSATVTGTGPDGNPTSDDSDDPNDPTDDDPNDDNNPDDSTDLTYPSISGTKQVVSTVPASSGVQGNFDVTYEFAVTSNGNTTMENVTLTDDMAAAFGGAFVGLASSPVITASTATDDPGINTLYDGGFTNANVFDSSSSLLESGETVTVRFTAEVDPDNPTAVYDFVSGDGTGDLENQGVVTGTDPETGEPSSDLTDDPTNPTNDDGTRDDHEDDDGDPDDPTANFIGSMAVTKTPFGAPMASVAGPAGNVDVVYEITIRNTGNDRITNMSLIEDFASQFGGAFVQVNLGPTIVSSTATNNPEINSSFNGSSATEIFDNTGLNTNELAPGESITIRIGVEMNPFSPTANVVNGEYLNSAVASGSGIGGGEPVTSISDDPSDPTNQDTDNDNNPDDPTAVSETDLTSFSLSDIGGHVYSDANGNGQMDPGESGIFGVEITLSGTDLLGNGITSTVFTDADGSYTFVDVNPGDYTITETHPSQFLDGNESVGTLGGNAGNDQITVSIQPGADDGFDYDFGEVGLRPELISKRLLLASSSVDSSSFMPTPSGPIGRSNPVGANAPNRSTVSGQQLAAITQNTRRLSESRQLASVSSPNITATAVDAVFAGESVEMTPDNLSVDLPFQLETNDNVVTAVGTVGDDVIELILGAKTHLLTMADRTFEFDAAVIDTFHIGGAQGRDSIRIVGTDLDDVASAMDDRGSFVSSAYSISTYAFEDMHFDGLGGDDYTQIYGSDQHDVLHGVPRDSTLTLPDSTMRMVAFERVDAYGRGGDDYAEVFGSSNKDFYYTFDTYQVLHGENFRQKTKGFERVDSYGRGGFDVAALYDTWGDDHFYAFTDYSVMQSSLHSSRVKGFEHTKAESINGGEDKSYFREIVSADVLFANSDYASINGEQRSVSAKDFDQLEIDVEESASPKLDVRLTTFSVDQS